MAFKYFTTKNSQLNTKREQSYKKRGIKCSKAEDKSKMIELHLPCHQLIQILQIRLYNRDRNCQNELAKDKTQKLYHNPTLCCLEETDQKHKWIRSGSKIISWPLGSDQAYNELYSFRKKPSDIVYTQRDEPAPKTTNTV